MVSFTVPIYWTKHFKTKPSKTVLVGMNYYRNAHHFDQNNLKKYFHDLIGEQIQTSKPITSPFEVSISLYYKNTNCDPSNIISLIEKFSLDALQEYNIISNDTVLHHKGTQWSVVEQNKENPRCIVSVN